MRNSTSQVRFVGIFNLFPNRLKRFVLLSTFDFMVLPMIAYPIRYSKNTSLASRLNGYMYSNGKNLAVALFILMANHLSKVTLQLLCVKNIPCRVASLINIFN